MSKKVSIQKAVSEGLIYGKQNFNAKTLWGVNVRSGAYIIHSYHKPIAVYCGGQWYITLEKFSPTSSRHINIVKTQADYASGLLGELIPMRVSQTELCEIIAR